MNGPDLAKTRTLLQRVQETYWFTTEDEEGARRTRVELDPDVFTDMGSPETITVTIEPGDLLNVEG